MRKIRIHTLQDLSELAPSLLTDFSPKHLVLLKGDLGAGKTTLVRAIAQAAGFEAAASPTYSLHNRYETSAVCIDHFDLYRLEDQNDLEAAGFFDSLSAEDNIVFVEWSERLDSAHIPLDRDVSEVDIQLKENVREISIRKL